MKEALYYKALDNRKLQCTLCPHYCVIGNNEVGLCNSRKNIDGELYTLNYGKTVTISADPIEKKPLYHFYPGEKILSIGPNFCNLTCSFCQNYAISQFEVPTQELSPQMLLELCLKNYFQFVAYTYTEPIIWFEYILEASILLQKNKIKTVMVSNGFINREPLLELLPHIDAMNIDLKAMDDEFYKKYCNGRLSPVLETIKTAAGNCHLEITNLLISNENDSNKNISDLVDFMAEIDVNIPLHFSKYYPHYKMMNSPTPESALYSAAEMAREKLNYVYLGNILTNNDTKCPKCGTILVRRDHHAEVFIENGNCPECGEIIYGKY